MRTIYHSNACINRSSFFLKFSADVLLLLKHQTGNNNLKTKIMNKINFKTPTEALKPLAVGFAIGLITNFISFLIHL
ncbi:hypothetical protein FLACOL7796_04423 [Flavobacterium collinsii]|uniref:Uncharacterized protein n=1 Tax=Flavobacterium collinsii TaxID=1114861 RepID=A0ABN7EQI1_9FLAO|nr:hypothetical protein FLACOL7796_04423 [Flavobacterium collinsii]